MSAFTPISPRNLYVCRAPDLVSADNKQNEVAKSGYLAKRGLKNPKYNRYWFRLKGDVLSYYTDPSDLYFPSGNIDLRYGITAHVADKEKGKDATYFTVVTHQRKFHFKADSVPSAKEWVKSLQKIIFRSHNDGDSVKISLPIENIIDIEDSQVVEFAETCKIRVIDNDETYAIDEVYNLNVTCLLWLTISVLFFVLQLRQGSSERPPDPR
jgi:sterol 3beta-glucosyltransferase